MPSPNCMRLYVKLSVSFIPNRTRPRASGSIGRNRRRGSRLRSSFTQSVELPTNIFVQKRDMDTVRLGIGPPVTSGDAMQSTCGLLLASSQELPLDQPVSKHCSAACGGTSQYTSHFRGSARWAPGAFSICNVPLPVSAVMIDRATIEPSPTER
jgi:hypothetical protein